jgi:hypothetical protein
VSDICSSPQSTLRHDAPSGREELGQSLLGIIVSDVERERFVRQLDGFDELRKLVG